MKKLFLVTDGTEPIYVVAADFQLAATGWQEKTGVTEDPESVTLLADHNTLVGCGFEDLGVGPAERDE